MIKLEEARVLVTPTSYAKNDPCLRTELEAAVGEVIYNTTGRPFTADQLIKIIPDFDGYIAGLDAVTKDVIAAADRMKVIARYGVGVDKVDLEAAQERGIVVTNTPGANSSSVAELTVGLMIALVRHIPAAHVSIKSGEWPRLRGATLEGKTIGLYGFGAIGQIVAKQLSGFGCELIVYDPCMNQQIAEELRVEDVSSDEIVKRSDILSLHCPVVKKTRKMVDSDFLDLMKPGSLLVNTARGELVDEMALYDAITQGHIAGAALDVFCDQPPDPENPLLNLSQVVATPHMGAHTDSATNNMGWSAFRNCLAVLIGEEPPNRVI